MQIFRAYWNQRTPLLDFDFGDVYEFVDYGVDGECRRGVYVEFGADVAEMSCHGVCRQEELVGYLLGG